MALQAGQDTSTSRLHAGAEPIIVAAAEPHQRHRLAAHLR